MDGNRAFSNYHALMARGASAGFAFATEGTAVAVAEAEAIFAARSAALLFVRGTIVGACVLLTRAFGFAAAGSAAPSMVPTTFDL